MSTDQTAQTIVTPAGVQLPKRYHNLATQVPQFQPPDPGKLRLFLQGLVGEGKSTFAASIPRACILDFENKYTAIPRRGEGTHVFYCADGDETEAIIDMLMADAEKDDRVFDTVVFDPMNGYIQQVRRLLTDRYVEAGLLKAGSTITEYGKGGSGWDKVNQYVNAKLFEVYEAGHGWVVLSHMIQRWVKSSEGSGETRVYDHSVNAGILNYLYQEAEFTGTIERVLTTKAVPTGRVLTLPSGKEVPQTRKQIDRSYELNLSHDDPKLPVRQHVPMPDEPIEIPEGRGWSRFRFAYHKSVEARMTELRTIPRKKTKTVKRLKTVKGVVGNKVVSVVRLDDHEVETLKETGS